MKKLAIPVLALGLALEHGQLAVEVVAQAELLPRTPAAWPSDRRG